MRRQLSRQPLVSIFIVIFISVSISLFLEWMGFFTHVESVSFDHRVTLSRTDKAIHEDVTVILIDERSLQQMDKEFGRWPWPRSAYADLLDFFAIAGAQAFAFDILFVEQQDAGHSNQSDFQLAEATRRAGNTVHAMQLLQSPLAGELPASFAELHAVEVNRYVGKEYNDFLIPFDSLYEATRDVGYLEIEPDRDGVYRRIRLFNRLNSTQVFPALSSAITLPLVSARDSVSYDKYYAEMGDLRIPLDGNGSFLINPYGQVNTYSVAEVFKAMKQIRSGKKEDLALDPKQFAGKVVFLGASAIGLLDVKATALTSQQAGVFLHAYTVSNILLQDFLVLVGDNATTALILLFCVISVVPVVLLQRLVIATVIPIATIIIYIFFVYFQFSNNLVYPVFPVLFAAAFSLLLAFSYRTGLENDSRRKVRKMLSQYVSPRVLTTIIDSNDDLHAEIGTTETLTILFSDIRGFTGISEEIEANKVVDLLNIYFTEMTEIIFEHDGTLDKFIGDAIMAFWGAPIKSSDHALEALRSAIEMRKGLLLVNQQLAEKGYPEIDIGIGIHTGKVVLGNIGSEKKLDYTIIGDSVNLASRLEGLTKSYGCSIIISEATYTTVQSAIPCILVDRVRVKGKLEPINLYAPAELLIRENNFATSAHDLQNLFEKAFSAYLRRDWQNAAKAYSLIGASKLTKMFEDRCKLFMSNDPGQNWDGVYTFTSK